MWGYRTPRKILLLARKARGGAGGRDRLERDELAVVELEAHRGLPAGGAAEGVVRTVERVGEGDFGVALAGYLDRGAGLGWSRCRGSGCRGRRRRAGCSRRRSRCASRSAPAASGWRGSRRDSRRCTRGRARPRPPRWLRLEGVGPADCPPCTKAGAGAVRVELAGCSPVLAVPVVDVAGVVAAEVVWAGVEAVVAVESVCTLAWAPTLAAGGPGAMTVFVPPPQPPSSTPPTAPRASAHASGNARRVIVSLFAAAQTLTCSPTPWRSSGCAGGLVGRSFFGAHPRGGVCAQAHWCWASVPSNGARRFHPVSALDKIISRC